MWKNVKILIFDQKTNVKMFEVVKKSKKVEEVRKSQVTDVEQVLTGRYSSQLLVELYAEKIVS